jgi:hypothetical protein
MWAARSSIPRGGEHGYGGMIEGMSHLAQEITLVDGKWSSRTSTIIR